jgi:hypothetical protein
LITNDQTIIEAKQNEFERGLAPSGDIIGRYRDVDYAVFKEQINPLANGNVDLKLTGSFQSQLYVKSLGNSRFQFDSRDGKAPMLFSRSYTDGVNGQVLRALNQDTFNDLQKKDYAPKLIRYIKQLTQL